MTKIVLIVASLLFWATICQAGSEDDNYNNDKAMKGLKETKAYFDVTLGEPKSLLIRLQLVEQTFKQLAAAKVTPTFIVGVRGKASHFFTKGPHYVLDTDLADKKKIAEVIERLHNLGISIEQCRIASGFEDIDAADFLPQVELVASGYVSMIGYQSKGYGLVPMD